MTAAVGTVETGGGIAQDLSAVEVRKRAASGAATMVIRGIAIRLISFGGNAVLARMLLPRDFGVVAFGLTAMNAISFLGDAGLGGALLRRRESPSRAELGALLAAQCLGTALLAVLVGSLAWPFGQVGHVTAVMVVALPIVAFRTPGAIVLQRDLRFRPLAFVELTETLTYTGWAVSTVVLGWGVWGVATAVLLRACVGSGAVLLLSPAGFIRPRPSWALIRPLLGFGARMQAQGLTNLVRDEGLNLGTAAIGGVATLGMWSLANRILMVPYLLFDSLWKVSYPAMARLIAAGEEPKPIIERSLRLSTAGTGLMLVAMVGASGALIPTIFGGRWEPATWVIPFAALGILLMGPVSVSTAGYLYAIGRPSTVLRGTVGHTLAWLVVGFSLLPVTGVAGLGVGWLAAGCVEVYVLGRAASREAGVRVMRSVWLPIVAAVASGTGGALLALRVGPAGLIPGALGGVTATAGYVLLVAALDRRLAGEVGGTVASAVRHAARSRA